MDFGFKILIETISGSQFAYTTESLVNLTPGTSQVVTTTQMVDKINAIPSSSFSNIKGAVADRGTFEFLPSSQFGNTNLGGVAQQDYQFLSMSIKDSADSGSILFQENTTSLNGDYLKRYKFFGNKVCNVLGVPENYWIYTDRFRLSNTASLSNHIEGDISATSVTVRNNFNVSNVGSVSSDLPFNLSKDTDRWIKYVDVSGSIPLNKMLIGYSQGEDYYGIKMPYSTDNLLLSASVVSASGDFIAGGDIIASAMSIIDDGGGGTTPVVNSSQTSSFLTANQTGSFLTNISYGSGQGVIEKTTPGGGGSPTSIGAITNLGTSGKPLFAEISCSGDISASSIVFADSIVPGNVNRPKINSREIVLAGNPASFDDPAIFFQNTNSTLGLPGFSFYGTEQGIVDGTNDQAVINMRAIVHNPLALSAYPEHPSMVFWSGSSAQIADGIILEVGNPSGSRLGIGTHKPTKELEVEGSISASGAFFGYQAQTYHFGINQSFVQLDTRFLEWGGGQIFMNTTNTDDGSAGTITSTDGDTTNIQLAPFDGYVRKILIQQAGGGSVQGANTEFTILKAGNGIDFEGVDTAGDDMGGPKTVTVDAADTTFTLDFDTGPGQDYEFSAGDKLAIKMDVDAGSNYGTTHVALVLMYKVD